MGNSVIVNAKSKTNKKSSIAKIFSLFVLLFASLFCFVGCDPEIPQNTSNATFDANGYLRILTPQLVYNYSQKNENDEDYFDPELSGSFSWNFSYYAKNVYSPEADEQYLGVNFYTTDPTEILSKRNLTDEDKAKLAEYIYKGDLSAVRYNSATNSWTDGNITLYRFFSPNIEFPNYEVVVDGKALTFAVNVYPNESTVMFDQTRQMYVLNTNAFYFTYLGETQPLSSEYIKIVETETNRNINSAETGIPFPEYMVVFNPQLEGSSISRTIKVKALAKEGSNRGDSAYSSTITYQASRLAFSVYSPNSADDISQVGYLEYDQDVYYFDRIKTTITANENDAKITYLEGYFPEGRVVKVTRKQVENSDFALSSWTTNTEATSNSVLNGTLPCQLSNFFNFASDQNPALTQSANSLNFIVNHYYSDDATPQFGFVAYGQKLNLDNKDNLFFDLLNIDKTTDYTTPSNLSSTINVVATSHISGYTFYANYSKVKNFTQSGTVFAGDEFFNGNSNHYLTGYTISIYEVDFDANGYIFASSDVFKLKSFDAIRKTQTSTTFNFTTNDGRTIEISINIDGSTFTVTGLEHNMCLIFDKVSTNNDETSGVSTSYTFHNGTMSSVLLAETITRSLFAQQWDKTLCGVIGTEYAESSNIEVTISQVDDDNQVGSVSSDVAYEIIKSVTTKEDIHGYVTTNIILSIIVPSNHMLVSYNVETPQISTQINYKLCTNPTHTESNCTCTLNPANYIYFNATTNTYYKTTQQSLAGTVTADGTGNYLLYNGQLYVYNFRDSTYENGVLTYNSYYYGNYSYNQDGSVATFESIVVSTQGNSTTYRLRQHRVLEDFSATNSNQGLVANPPTIITTLEQATDFLETYLTNYTSGILLNNNSSSLQYSTTVYYFERTLDSLTVTPCYYDYVTNGDISSIATAYKSNLTYTYNDGEGEKTQDVYFYYDIKSRTQSGTTTHYYTSPIGRQLADDSTQWFYNFTNTNYSGIVLGRDILQNQSRYQTFYNLLGQKIVNNYYYYVEPVTPCEVYVRQYNDITMGQSGGWFYFTEDDPNGTPGSEYNLEYDIQEEVTSVELFKSITIDGINYRITFNPATFEFVAQRRIDGELTDVTNTLNFSFNFDNGGILYDRNGSIVPFSDSIDEILPQEGTNFRNSGTYSFIDSGFSFIFTVSYQAVKLDNDLTTYVATYDGTNWIIDNQVITDFSQYFIYPSIKIGDENGTDAFVAASLVDNNESAAIISSNSQENTYNYYYIDSNKAKHDLTYEPNEGYVYVIEREAFVLDPTTNQKTQIMVWGKFVPTSDPNEPIIYPSFSCALEYDNAYIFDPINSFYFDIDYSTDSAKKDGFIGSSLLSGPPYPNPVLILSVRHKANEYAQVNIAVDIKSVFFAEVMADKLENSSSNLVLDFSTYSFKDTLDNIDSQDYINNIYYVLDRTTLSHINAFKLNLTSNGDYVVDPDYEDGLTLRVNEIFVADDGIIYWTDAFDANGVYTNPVYVRTTVELNSIAIGGYYYRPLTESECYAWRTSKKYIKDVGYFDIHGYSEDRLTGKIIFNSGELDINDVCSELEGLVLGDVHNIADDYDFDQVIIAGTTSAYRTSVSYINSMIYGTGSDYVGYTPQTSIPVIDSYDTNETYFLKGRECLVLIADPMINFTDEVYYRFLEWRVYSRYNSGVLYYDQAETESLGNERFSATMVFNPENVGHYVILPVYQRVFEVSVATEVENGPQNQGGSIVVYYKDGASVNLDGTTLQEIYTIEYLQTEVGGKLGYYYSNIQAFPCAYFDDEGNIATNLTQVFYAPYRLAQLEDGTTTNLWGVFETDNGYEIKGLKVGTSEDAASGNVANKLFALTYENLRYYLIYDDPNLPTDTSSNKEITAGVAFLYAGVFAQPTVSGNDQIEYTYLCSYDDYLYNVNDVFDGLNIDPDYNDEAIAKLERTEITIVEILEGIISSEYGDYYHNSTNDLVAGEMAYDEDGKLNTTLSFKNSYIDRESEVMLSAIPDEGYRLLGWYTVDGQSLYELYGEEQRFYSESDKITPAYFYNGNYYYTRTENEDGSFTYPDTEIVPAKLLYKVRGYYINTQTEVLPNYVEVFYSPAKDKYFYDSTYTIAVEDKYLYEYDQYGNPTLIVKEMPHVDAITSITDENSGDTFYYLNGLQVYKFGDFYYTSFSTGNIKVEGNNLIISSLHSNIEFVAVFREVYQAMILTDSEEEFGVSIEAVYYYNEQNNNLANRIGADGQIIPIDDNTIEYGFDKSAQNVDPNLFKLFDVEDDNNFASTIVSDLSPSTDESIFNMVDENGIYNGYVALSKNNYSGFNAWQYFMLANGLNADNGTVGKQAMPSGEGESFALQNLYFDDNTTAIIVVRTLSSSPLELHTLGLPSEYNLQPIIYPSDEYIISNSTKPSLTENTSDVLDVRADYLYYVFEVTFNRDPENEYADLIVHPTREISISLDILTGNYLNTYSNYFDVELTYEGLNSQTAQTKTNSVYFNFADYFTFTKIDNRFNFRFINHGAFMTNVMNPLLAGIVDIDFDSETYREIYNNITGYNNLYIYRFVEFLDYINSDVLHNTEQNLNIGNVKLSQEYLNNLYNALNGNTLNETQKANLQENITALELEGLIQVEEDGTFTALAITTLNGGTVNEIYYIDRLFATLQYLLVENKAPDTIDPNSDKDQEYYDTYAYVNKYTHAPVGDGSVNIINLTAIKMYSFSIQSLTIDGYDANGNAIFSEENAHELGNSGTGYFEFYTSVGTNNRTYMGSISPEENFAGIYYNGALTDTPTGIQFTNHYVDTDPDYQKDKNLPSYVYKDFLLAENTLLLIEGLAEQSTNVGYQFMGWYQQKRITSIYNRFFDLEDNKLNVVNENTNYAFGTDNAGNTIVVYAKDSAVGAYHAGDPVPAPSRQDVMTNWLYFIDPETLELYRQDGVLVESTNYQYVEWSSLELVSTTYKYPYVALSNADTVITALFKRVVELEYSFNPIEMSVTSSTSTDSLGAPLKYSVYQNDGTNIQLLGENITDKQEAYKLIKGENYVSTNTYEIRVKGNFYIDATPTLTISPSGGYRLDGVYEVLTDDLGQQSLNKVKEINDAGNTVLSFSNTNSLLDTNIAEPSENPVSTYDSVNLAGIVYTTVVINRLFNTENVEQSSKHITFKTQRVTLAYSQIENYYTFDADTGLTTAKNYDFILYYLTGADSTTILTPDQVNDNADGIFFDTRIFKNTLSFGQDTPSADDDFTVSLDITNLLTKNFNRNETLPAYAMNEGFLDEWIFNCFLSGYLSCEYYANNYSVAELTDIILNSTEYQDVLSNFAKTSSNTYIYLEIANNNLIFYAYLDNTFTDENTLNIITSITNNETKDDAIDHWYINAQTPSSISGADTGSDLNENVTFPTTQNITFEKPTNTLDPDVNAQNAQYNDEFKLSKNNLVYHLRAIIEDENKQTISITLQDNVNSAPQSLADLGVSGNTNQDGTISGTDNAFDDLIEFTFTGIKYASQDGDLNIDTSEAADNTNANGTISTKYHTGRYGTNTNFVLTISEQFLVIDNTITYPNGTLTQADVYAFVGWVVNGVIVSTDLSLDTNEGGTIEARFVKIAQVTLVNGDDGTQINMEYLEIESQAYLDNSMQVESQVFGFYPEGDYYYALAGYPVHFKVYPDYGYVLESVSHTNPNFGVDPNAPEFITAPIYYGVDTYPYFEIEFMVDSIVKINIREGFTLTIDQILFNDFYQTTQGSKFTGYTLYNIWKLEDDAWVARDNFQVFAQGSRIRLEFNPNDQPYSIIGWYINNELVSSTDTVEFELTENTVVELRIVKNIYLNIKASTSYYSNSSALNQIQQGITVTFEDESTFHGTTDITGNQITVKAGEQLKIGFSGENLGRTFLGWYYMIENETQTPKLLSTNYNFIFTINADNPYINNNSVTIVAVFAFTKQITIEKTLEGNEPKGEDVQNIDVIVNYTNGYGNEVSTNLGSSTSITINALLGTDVVVEAIVSEDNQERYFFEGFWQNGNIVTYENIYTLNTNSLNTTQTTLRANFVEGNLVTVTRRLNDDPYTGDTISLNVKYGNTPATLTGKTLTGEDEYVELGFKSDNTNNLVVSYLINPDFVNNYRFIGWFIDGKPLSYYQNIYGTNIYIEDGSTLTIVNPSQNLPENANLDNDKKNTLIEARFAELAQITLSRNIDGNSNDSNLSNFTVTAYYNTLTQNNVSVTNLVLSNTSGNSATGSSMAYKYTSLALTASSYAGYEFIGFRVNCVDANGNTISSEFIRNEDGTINTNDVVYYYLDNSNETQITSYVIEACYSKQYTINTIGTIMGQSSASVSFGAENPTTISNFFATGENLTQTSTITSSCDGYSFVGYFDAFGNQLGTDQTLTFSNADLIRLATGDQIFIEARYTRTVTITVEAYNREGKYLSSTYYDLDYGVDATIKPPENLTEGFTAWALPNPDGTNRLVAYYSTDQSLRILPLENKTYYALCGGAVNDFSNYLVPHTVVSTSSNGLIADGSTYSEIRDENGNIVNFVLSEYEPNSSNQQIDTLSVRIDDALERGYLFVGWVAGAKYLIGDGYHYLPLSNNLTIDASNYPYNDIFAVFTRVNLIELTLSGDSHVGSYIANLNNATTLSGIRTFSVTTSVDGKTTTIKLLSGTATANISAISGYNLESNANSTTISTQRIVKNITIQLYQNGDEQRVAVIDDAKNAQDNIKTTQSNTDHDSITYDAITETMYGLPITTITVNNSNYGSIAITNQNGDIIYNQNSNNSVSVDKLIFDNLFVTSNPNTSENAYLAYYEVIRVMDNGTRTKTYIITLKHFSFKVLDGAITITPVFRKSFDVIINNTVENITDLGNTTVEDVTPEGATTVTKQVNVTANEDYRISGIVIDNDLFRIDYINTAGQITMPTLPSSPVNFQIESYELSERDAAGRAYVKNLKLNITSEQDVKIAFVYNKVTNINLIDDITDESYLLYADDSIIEYSTTNGYVKTTDYLTPADIKALYDIESDKTDGARFLGYYYNNKVIPQSGLDITQNTIYDIVAMFAQLREVEVSFKLLADNRYTQLNTLNNGTTLGTYNSVFNTPSSGFRIDVTRLSEDTSSSDQTTTTTVLDNILNSVTIEFYNNNNLVVQAFGNSYFTFAGWQDQNGNIISSNATINPNTYSDITELKAVFVEETRTMILNPDYEGGEIFVGATEGSIVSLQTVLEDTNNTNKTIALSSGRNLVVGTAIVGGRTVYTLKYSVASSELGDTFYIIDRAFSQTSLQGSGEPYTLTYEGQVYKFKNFTQQNDKIIRGYTYNHGGINPPSATVFLEDFYQSQTLNLNTVKLINIQYTYAINEATDISSLVITVTVNNSSKFEIDAQTNTTVYRDAIINIWVEEGDVVTITASDNNNFNTIGFSLTSPIIKTIDNTDYLNVNIAGKEFPLDSTHVIGDLTIDEWQQFVAQGAYSNLTTLFNRTSSDTETTLDSISNYSFIATDNIYFLADYIPVFTFNTKYINAVLGVTDKTTNLSSSFTNVTNDGHTFAIVPATPDSNVPFYYQTNSSTILGLIDRNNNLISQGIPEQILDALTYFEQTTNTDDEFDNTYYINTTQTNDIFASSESEFGENGLSAIIEQLANVSVSVGYIDALTTSSNDTTTFVLNHYKTLYDEFLDKLFDLKQEGNAIDNSLLSFANDVSVNLSYFANSEDATNNTDRTTLENYVYEDADVDFTYELTSYIQSYLKAGNVISVKTSVNGQNIGNWFFKGFMIINSASRNSINLFADGEQLAHTSTYSSYKIISREDVDIAYDSTTQTYTYTLPNISLSGDTQIIALYEKVLHQIDIRLKDLSDTVYNSYEQLLAQNSNDTSALEGQSINGIDLDEDQNSSSGKLASTTTAFAYNGEPAIITTQNYPFSNLVGWATNYYRQSNMFVMEGGSTKTIDEVKALFASENTTFLTFESDEQLILTNPQNARNNLYINNVTSNLVVGAYFAPMSYVISFVIKETDLAAEQSDGVTNYSNYVSIKDENGNVSFIETYYDQNANELDVLNGNAGDSMLYEKSKIKVSLIDVAASLDPEPKVTYTIVNGQTVINYVLDEEGNHVYTYYLKYKGINNNYVLDANNKNQRIEIVFNQVPTGVYDENGVEITEPAQVNTSNFFKQTNITLYNYSDPSNISTYFERDTTNTGAAATYIKPGLISVSFNNKRQVDLSSYNIVATPIDAEGNVIELDESGNPVNGEVIANYKVNFVVTAKANVGFPSVKIMPNSPSDDQTVIPFSFDDSEYLEKMQEFTKTNELSDISYFDQNSNSDLRLISGFYNRMFENTELFTDPDFQLSNCNFTLYLMYGKKSTPLVAKITDGQTEVELTSRPNEKTAESDLDFVIKNIVSYKYYIVENGAYLTNKLLELQALMDYNNTKTDEAFNSINCLILLLSNFPKIEGFEEEYENNHTANDSLLTYFEKGIFNRVNTGLNTGFIEAVMQNLITYGLVDPAFNIYDTLKITQLNVFEWYTGKQINRTLAEIIDQEYSENNVITDQNLLSFFQNPRNETLPITPDETNENAVYKARSSEEFSPFYVKSGDSVVTHVELALQYVPERRNIGWFDSFGDKAKLAYNKATLTYKSSQTLGRLYMEYDNDITNVTPYLEDDAPIPTTWEEIRNLFSALSLAVRCYEGSYISDFTSSCYLTPEDVSKTTSIINVLTIDSGTQLAVFDLPFWLGSIPTGNIVTGTVATAALIAGSILIFKFVPAAGQLTKVARWGIRILKAAIGSASAVNIALGVLTLVGVDNVSSHFMEINWYYVFRMSD